MEAHAHDGIHGSREEMPSPAQFRAARAILGWSMVDTAQAGKVSVMTIRMVEGPSPDRVSMGGRVAVREAYEAAGVRFVQDGDAALGLWLATR